MFNFYNEISIIPPKIQTHIFHISKPPVDVDTFTKVQVKDNGLNPEDYNGSTNFSIPHKEFYLKLFSYRKADPPNANLLFFLTDFTTKKKDIMVQEIK